MSNEWITDRLPNDDDARQEQVWLASNRRTYLTHFTNVKLGDAWKTIEIPEPYVKPNKADANLIAAAPELLEAAERFVERWDNPLWESQEMHTGRIIARLRAAIAKAKGGKKGGKL